MERRGDTLVLENEENYVKFNKLLSKAMNEGRVDGRFRCTVCGMRYNDESDSLDCCDKVPRSV